MAITSEIKSGARIKLPIALFCLGLLALSLLITPVQAKAETEHEAFSRAIGNFEALGQDKVKGAQRQPWEKVEASFAAIRNGKGVFAAEAFFYQARSREELADRSKRKSDYVEAVRLYSRMAQEYASNALADNAIYNQAMILSGPLKDKSAAVKALDALLMQYPDSDMAAEANILRERLESNGAFIRPSGSGSGASATAATGATSTTVASGASPTATSSTATLSSIGSTTAGVAAIAKPTAAAEAKQRQLYEAAATTWHELVASKSRRAGHRDVWENLEQRFRLAEQAAPGGSYADKAAYQVARCREELAKRSKAGVDWRAAAALYTEMAAKYPNSNLADDALGLSAKIFAAYPDPKPAAASTQIERSQTTPTRQTTQVTQATQVRQPDRAVTSQPSGGTTTRETAQSQLAGGSAKSQPAKGSSGVKQAADPRSGGLARLLAWQGDQNKFTLTIEFSGKAKYNRATLPPQQSNSSGQIQLEFFNSILDKNVQKNLNFSGLPVRAISTVQTNKNTVRLVLDLAQVRSYKVSALYSPYRIKVEVSATAVLPGGFDLSKASGSKPGNSGTAQAAGNARPKPAGSIVEQLGLSVKTVVLDAGHGGKDPGAVGNGITESQYTLELAKMLGQQLQKQGFSVIYTRSNNRYLALQDRTTFANERKADIFISLHVNSSTNKKLGGVETYYLDAARNDAASVVAARENSVDVNATSDLQFILSDLTRNSKLSESRAVAALVQERTLGQLKRNGFSVHSNGVRSAPFYVLMGARMPAFLFEVGYLSNSGDVARLKNKKYMESLAIGIANGIVAYRNQINSIKP